MIHFIDRKHIDTRKWDECISAYPLDIVYGHSWYLDIVSPGWGGLIKGDYDYVMPVTGKSKFGVHYIAQPFFTQQLGVFSKKNEYMIDAKPFIDALVKKFKYIDIQLNERNDVSVFNEKVNYKKTYKLDLSKDYEALKKAYSQNHKRNIKKAKKQGITVINNIDPSFVIQFKKQNNVNQLKKNQFNILKQLIIYLKKEGIGKMYGAVNRSGGMLSEVVFLFNNRRVFYILASSNQEGKSSGAAFFLLDRFIKDHAGQSLVLDFEGSEIPGIARFFNGFGGMPEKYSRLNINNLPTLVKRIKT